jgi:hypothetical protein
LFAGHHHWNAGVNLTENFRLHVVVDSICEVCEPVMQPMPEGEPVIDFGRHRHRAQASNVLVADLALDAARLDQTDPQPRLGLAKVLSLTEANEHRIGIILGQFAMRKWL